MCDHRWCATVADHKNPIHLKGESNDHRADCDMPIKENTLSIERSHKDPKRTRANSAYLSQEGSDEGAVLLTDDLQNSVHQCGDVEGLVARSQGVHQGLGSHVACRAAGKDGGLQG